MTSDAKPPKKHFLKTGSAKQSGESARVVTLINCSVRKPKQKEEGRNEHTHTHAHADSWLEECAVWGLASEHVVVQAALFLWKFFTCVREG